MPLLALWAVAALWACAPGEARPPVPLPGPTGSAAPPPLPVATAVQLSGDVTPRAYDLHLVIDPRQPRFSGEVTIDVDVRVATRALVLHGRDLAIQEAFVESAGRRLPARAVSRAAFGARDAKGELVLTTEEDVAAGAARLILRWDAPYASLAGLYRTEVGPDAFAFTQMEAIDARRAFPCFDEPRFKTPFAVRITAPADVAVFANGVELRTEPSAADLTHVFATTPPLPAYLTAFAVGKLERKTWANRDFGIVAVAGRAAEGKESVEASERILASQAAYFGIPYAYGKLDVVAVPDFGPGAMENPGLVTFRDEFLLLGQDPPAETRRRMRSIVAHELAHQWFGDLVTMHWWDDLWLNEAFATWMGPKTVAEVYPETAMTDDRVLYEARAIDGDVLPSATAVRPKITTEDAIHEAGGWSAYLKGSTVLAMVERWMGADRFQQGLQLYMREHAHGGASFPDLVSALSRSAPELPVEAVLKSFLEQPGVPLVRAAVTCHPDRRGPSAAELTLRVEALRVDDPGFAGMPVPAWSTPVCARVEGEAAPVCTLIGAAGVGSVPLGRCPGWVHPDAGEVGYYRWSLEDAWWTKLLGVAGKLTPAERAGLVLDAWSLAQTGRADVGRVVAALRALGLRKDEPRVVVDAVVTVLRDLERTVVDDTTRAPFQTFVRSVLEPVAVPEPKLPRTTAGDEQRLLRVVLLGALGELAPGPRADAALARARKGAPDPDLETLALRLDARRGAPAALDLATEAGFVAATKDRAPFERTAVLMAMGSFGDEARQRQALEVVLTPSFRAGDWRYVRQAVSRSPEGRRALIAFMTERFEPLARKLGGAGSLTASIGSVCEQGELDRLLAFFGPRMETLEGAQRGFDEGRAQARRCIDVRARLAPAFGAALAKR